MRRWWLLVTLIAGCVESRLVVCDDDTLCPVGSICAPGGGCANLGDCGNGLLDSSEVCDDGNRISGDGCNATCTSLEICGNGVADFGEACDCGDAAQPGGTACGGTFNGGERCRLDCLLPECGNGDVDGIEACDDGNTSSGDGCAATCASNETCGNGVIDFGIGEQCDDGNDVDHDGCQHTCVVQRCGDGIADSGEVCDDGNLVSGDGCAPDCASDESCGNAIIDFFAGERCDDGNKRSHDGCHSSCQLEVATWAATGPEVIPPRASRLAYDTQRERVVMYIGWPISTPPVSETYELVGAGWVRANPVVSPPPRAEAPMVYDVARGEVVLFGGWTDEGYSGETWTYNGSAWRLREPALSPSARSGSGMAYDPIRERVVLQGGEDENGYVSDTWEWDGSTWSLRAPSDIALRSTALERMAYDFSRGAVVRLDNSGYLWELGTSAWTELTAIASVTAGPLAYDLGRDRLYAYGPQPYELVGTTWTPTTGALPTATASPVIAYDAASRTMVLYGTTGKTWRRTLLDWGEVVNTSVRPPALIAMGLAYDMVRDRLVVFGGDDIDGNTLSNQTWEFDGSVWRQFGGSGPSGREAPAMTYDVKRKVSVLFGGEDNTNTVLADTWEFDGVAWTPKSPTGAIENRVLSAMTYDSDAERCVLVGGRTQAFAVPTETWAYSGTSWATLPQTMAAPARYDHTLAYDEANNRVVAFGGYYSGPLGDTWSYNGATWAELGTPVQALDYPAIAYLPSRGRIVRFGGFESRRVYELDGASWRTGPQTTFDRWQHRMVADTLRDRVLVFGGESNFDPYFANDLWEYKWRSEAPDEYCAGGGDRDGDGLAGCADPDCTAACSPMCPPLATCPVDTVRCGDGTCGPSESKRLCPQDCGAITPLCGDGRCDTPENATSCNADC